MSRHSRLKTPRYGLMVAVFLSSVGLVGIPAVAAPPDQLDATVQTPLRITHGDPVRAGASTRVLTDGIRQAAPFGGAIAGIDTLPNFTGQFTANGVDWNGNPQTVWSYAMVGRAPTHGGTTRVRAPLIPVSVDLRDADGNPRYINGARLYSDATRYAQTVLASPIFQSAPFPGNEDSVQFADAVQRAEFTRVMGEDWHTQVAPTLGKARVMTVAQDPTCTAATSQGGPGHCNYHFALNADGTCCYYILMDEAVFNGLLFPPTYPVDGSTIVGAAEVSGDMRTTDITSFLFPDTYLYADTTDNCCVLGFHSFDYEPGATPTALPRFYVMEFASWVTPGIFGDSFADITALSHEMSETFNDPFVVYDGVTDATPWWLAPNGNCQNDFEVGDVVEGLPNATYPVKMKHTTYHVQNVALLQWFARQSPSTAFAKAYTYPDPTVVTALSPPEGAGCTGPAPAP